MKNQVVRIPSEVLILILIINSILFYGSLIAEYNCREKLQSLSSDQPVTTITQGESSEESSEGRSKLQDR